MITFSFFRPLLVSVSLEYGYIELVYHTQCFKIRMKSHNMKNYKKKINGEWLLLPTTTKYIQGWAALHRGYFLCMTPIVVSTMHKIWSNPMMRRKELNGNWPNEEGLSPWRGQLPLYSFWQEVFWQRSGPNK